MSEFVPLGGQQQFRAGLVDPALGGGETSPRDASVSEPSSQDSPDVPDESVAVSLPQTLEELAVIVAEAEERGRSSAEAVLANERASTETDRASVGRIMEAVEAARNEWVTEVRNTLGELVVVGVRQVVSDSVEIQKELLRDRMAEIGERMIGERSVVVRVRPDDEEQARLLVGGREGWQVVPDPTISAGVIAETESGKIDATLGSAVAGLATGVREWQDEGAGEE